MASTTKTKVIGYARLSHATEESTSIARQHKEIKDFAAQRGYELIGIEQDSNISASKKRLDRPGLDRVRKAIASGAAEHVVVWRLDRLARSVRDISVLLDEGVLPISTDLAVDASTSMGRAMIEMSQVFSGLETRATSERVTNTVNYLRRHKRFPGGPVPYGYMTAPMPVQAGQPPATGRILVPNPAEAKIVREVADRVLKKESLYSVCQDLNARGVPTRFNRVDGNGKPKGWAIQTLRGVLLSPATLGRVAIKGDVVRDEQGRPQTVWEPLLPLADVERLRVLLAPRRGRSQRRRATRLLSGLLRCESCGGTLHVKVNGSGALAYACASRSAGYPCASPVSVSAERVEECVESAYLATAGHKPMVRVTEAVPDVAGRAEVEEALRETALAMTEPDADIAGLTARLAELRAERETIAAAPSTMVTTVEETGQTIADAWAEAKDDVAKRRALLADPIEVIVVKPGRRGATTFDPSRLSITFRE